MNATQTNAAYELACIVAALSMGIAVGLANWGFEKVGFAVCRKLESAGVVQRFHKGGRQLELHNTSNISSVAVPYIFLYYVVYRFLWPELWEGMRFDMNPLKIWAFISVAMVGHDLWFYSVHTFFHWNRALYRKVHKLHHSNGANLTALGTAFGDLTDIGLCFVAYHALIVLYLWARPQWNPVAVLAYITVEAITNVTGHTGYQLPLWLHLLATGGVGGLPFSATTKTHYIHHLDPRYNRALYFTIWDRLAGTYRGSHALIAA